VGSHATIVYPTDTSKLTLADEMKTATAELHRLAEKTGVVADMLNQRVCLANYVLYARNLLHIYQLMESPIIPESHVPQLDAFLDPKLKRADLLERDLDNLVGRNQWLRFPLMPGTKNYGKNIESVKAKAPIAIVGHCYVRYLGDLFGGQILKKLLIKQLGLNTDTTNFYHFTNINDIPEFRAEYRTKFNKLRVNSEDRKMIIDTAKQCFQFNIQISTEIKPHLLEDCLLKSNTKHIANQN